MRFSFARKCAKSRLVSAFVAIGLFSQIFVAAGAESFPVLEAHNKYILDLLSGVKWVSGSSFLDSSYEKLASLNDYEVETRLTGKMKDHLKEGGARFFFKKKQRVRLEVTKGATNQGSVVVRRDDGVIKCCGGGMLKFITLTLDDNSRLLQLPSGHNVIKSDLPDLLNEVRSRLKSGSKSRLTSDIVTGTIWKTPVKVVEITDGAFDTVTDRIFINPKTNVPAEWDVYRDGGLVSMTFFDNFKGNAGLDDSLFVL